MPSWPARKRAYRAASSAPHRLRPTNHDRSSIDVVSAALLEGFGAAARAVDADTHFYPFCWHYDAIAESLSHTRSRRATEALVSVLEVDARSLPGRTDRVRSVQGHAICTLGHIADPVSLDWVLAAYQDREFRHKAAAALAAFPDQRAQDIVAAHGKKKERCFLCGKDEVQAMLSPLPSAIRRAGGDAVVASMVSYIEAARSGNATVKCRCGMWACRACLAGRMTGIYESHECPGCNASFTRK